MCVCVYVCMCVCVCVCVCLYVFELLQDRLSNSLHSFTGRFSKFPWVTLSIFHDLRSKVNVTTMVKVCKSLKSGGKFAEIYGKLKICLKNVNP